MNITAVKQNQSLTNKRNNALKCGFIGVVFRWLYTKKRCADETLAIKRRPF
jgi:hypothetical protein